MKYLLFLWEYIWAFLFLALVAAGIAAILFLLIMLYLKWLFGNTLFSNAPTMSITMSSHAFCVGDRIKIFPTKKGNYSITKISGACIEIVRVSVVQKVISKYPQLKFKF